MPQLTQDQIEQLKSLGIETNNQEKRLPPLLRDDVPQGQEGINLDIRNSDLDIKHPKNPIFPLLSISGLTILSFSGLILFKNKSQTTTPISTSNYTLPQTSVTPTQVPKSIQHYLLTSQQYFTQASQQQN